MRFYIVVPLALLIGFAVLIETVSSSGLSSFECPKCPDCPKWCPPCRQCPNRCDSCKKCYIRTRACGPCPNDPDEYCKKKKVAGFWDQIEFPPETKHIFYTNDQPGLRDRCERLRDLDSMGVRVPPDWSIGEEIRLRARCQALQVNAPIDPDFEISGPDVCPACPVCPESCPPCERCRTDCEGCPNSPPCPPACPCPKLSKRELDDYCKKRQLDRLGKQSRKFQMPKPGPSLYDPEYIRLERIELCKSWLGDLKEVEDPEESADESR